MPWIRFAGKNRSSRPVNRGRSGRWVYPSGEGACKKAIGFVGGSGYKKGESSIARSPDAHLTDTTTLASAEKITKPQKAKPPERGAPGPKRK